MNTIERDPAPKAAILSFPRRRGRPRCAPKGIDTGTPELAYKRRSGETSETLDLCLERGIITQRQHWSGIHLRWLYTLRYGAPGVKAIDPTHVKGIDLHMDDPMWRIEREKEYHEAIGKITLSGHALMLMNICIYNERPRFLTLDRTQPQSADTTRMIEKLTNGLDILCRLWERNR